MKAVVGWEVEVEVERKWVYQERGVDESATPPKEPEEERCRNPYKFR